MWDLTRKNHSGFKLVGANCDEHMSRQDGFIYRYYMKLASKGLIEAENNSKSPKNRPNPDFGDESSTPTIYFQGQNWL